MELPQINRLVEEPAPRHADGVDAMGGRHVQLDSRALQQSYDIEDERVERYLRDSPFLLDLLVDAVQPLRRHFPSARLSLEVVDDPEADNDRQLALAIVSPLPPEELMDRLRLFDDEWWLDQLPRAQDRLFITLGFE